MSVYTFTVYGLATFTIKCTDGEIEILKVEKPCSDMVYKATAILFKYPEGWMLSFCLPLQFSDLNIMFDPQKRKLSSSMMISVNPNDPVLHEFFTKEISQ